jgi:hypothetical protein
MHGFAPYRQRPDAIRFPVAKIALVSQLLQRQYALTIWLAVRKFPFVTSSWPGLGAFVGLTAVAPHAFIGLAGRAIFGPAHDPLSLCVSVGARSRPSNRFAQLRIRVPNLAAGFLRR